MRMGEPAVEYAAWKLFIDAVELGSLSKVAVAHGTSQPHISRQISDLEQQYGGRLFQRTGRGVVLTELGQRMAPKVRAWLADTQQLANDLRASAGTPIGKIRIGSLPSTAHPLTSTLYKRLKQQYPLIQLAVREGQGAQLETWLEDGSVDLAILLRTSKSKSGDDTYLVETPTYLVSAARDPLTSRSTVAFSKLHNLPFVLFCRPSSWRDHLEQIGRQHGVLLNVVLEADSLNLQTNIIAEGGVYGLLGHYAITAAAKDGRLQSSKLVEPVIPRYIALAVSRHAQNTLACRTVIKMVTDIAKSGAARLRGP
jgi:LysR family nitrogen assimilation transcriptional regulator